MFRNISHQATQPTLQQLWLEPTLSEPAVPFPSKELEDIRHRTRQVLSSRTRSAAQRKTEEFIQGHNRKDKVYVSTRARMPTEYSEGAAGPAHSSEEAKAP